MDDEKFQKGVTLIKGLYESIFKLDGKKLIFKSSGPAWIVRKGDKEIKITQVLIDDNLTGRITEKLKELIE